MRTFWLNFHLAYACRHSGACCSSGWPIPVERDRVIPIGTLAARAEESWLVPVENAPEDVAGTLAVRPNGECTFFRIPTRLRADASARQASVVLPAGSCAVHPARPASCAHFPYVCLIDSRGVRVTLSHYCPTAASMLFEHEGPIEIVEGPPPIAGVEVPEGLDARESLPPVEVPNRLMTFEAFSDWERAEVGKAVAAPSMADALARFELARFAVPFPWSWAEAPTDLEEGWAALVAPAWPEFAPVLQRYRAAKLFASWAAYTDAGLAAVVRVADIADAVLRVEAVRQCEAAQRGLDAELLEQAIRQSDLLLVHYADGWVLSSGSTP
jgi:Fe-S-cluster containining protein